MTNQALALELRKHSERFFDGSLRWLNHSSHPEVDGIQRVEPEASQIIMDGIDQFLAQKRVNPRFVRWPPGAYFGDDHQSIGIGMKGLFDDLVGHMRTVKIAGIDMVDPVRNSLAQNGYGSFNITGRPPHLWPRQLHGAVTHSVQAHRSTGKCEGAAKVYLLCHFVSPLVRTLWLDEESFSSGVRICLSALKPS